MGQQPNDRDDENQQAQGPGTQRANDQRRKPEQDTTRERLASDDDLGGEPDADGELSQPGQQGNADRERSGSTRSRNP